MMSLVVARMTVGIYISNFTVSIRKRLVNVIENVVQIIPVRVHHFHHCQIIPEARLVEVPVGPGYRLREGRKGHLPRRETR
jgi:hypothetical protein